MIQAVMRNTSTVMRNLKQRDEQVQAGVNRGLRKVGLKIMEWADPYIPVEHGTMKRSKFIEVTGTGTNARVKVGFRAAYAVYVHENLDVAHGHEFNVKHAAEIAAGTEKPRGEKQQAKFLERAINEHRSEIPGIIKMEASVK